MAKIRSPNYPNHNLGSALELARKIFAKDGRNKVARLAVAKHLGHDSLSGPALGKIGALRAYGLMEGSGDELRVTDDAIAALMAPESSKERKEAMERLALKPSLFQDIQSEYPTTPSADNLAYWLIQQGFSPTAAAIAANSYLETIALVNGLDGSYSPTTENDSGAAVKAKVDAKSVTPPQPGDKQVKVMEGERVAFTEEGQPGQYLKLIASGDVDDSLLEALEDFVKRQRKRLKIWYTIDFTSDLAETEVGNFATALQSKFEAAGMPDGCQAYRYKTPAGNESVLLSPAAATLALQIPAYKAHLESCAPPLDFKNAPELKSMGIFK